MHKKYEAPVQRERIFKPSPPIKRASRIAAGSYRKEVKVVIKLHITIGCLLF